MIFNASQARIFSKLRNFVTDVATDSKYRFKLCHHPQATLAARGLNTKKETGKLTIPEDSLTTDFDADTIFGLELSSKGIVLPYDIRLISYKVKSFALVYGHSEYLFKLIGWAKQHHLTALLLPFEYIFTLDVGKGGYSNSCSRRQLRQTYSNEFRCLVVGTDEDETILGWLSLFYKWDVILGQLLDYPDCCIREFSKRWSKAVSSHQGDVSLLTLQASGIGPFDWRVNIFNRYFNLQLISHFPCCFTCFPSLKLAQRYEAALRWNEPEYFYKVKHVLEAPTLYTDFAGVFTFPSSKVNNKDNYYFFQYDSHKMLASEHNSSLTNTLRELDLIVAELEGGLLTIGQGNAIGYLAWFH